MIYLKEVELDKEIVISVKVYDYNIVHNRNVNFQTEDQNYCFKIATAAQVFKIDHLLQEILSFVDFFDLKNCRLAQKNWAYCGAKEMAKRAEIDLYFSKSWITENLYKQELPPSTIPTYPNRLPLNIPKDKYSELLRLTKTANKFPCSFFQVHSNKLMSSPVQNFFNSVGHCVTKLTLAVQYRRTKYSSNTAGSDVMESVKLLLTQQMPNLIYLKVNYFHHFHNPRVCINEMEAWNGDTAKHIIDFDCDSQSKHKVLKLKTLIVDSVFPERAIKEILEAAPHLISFSVQSRRLSHKIEPILENFMSGSSRFRINILKHISFHPDDSTVPIFEKILEQHSGFLKLTQFGFWNFNDEATCTLPNFMARVNNIIFHVLWSNSDWLEKLTISPLASFDVAEIPKMPRLKKLTFCYMSKSCMGNEKDSYYFPFGFSMAQIFPALKIIEVGDCELSATYCGLNVFQPVPSVEIIVLPKPYYDPVPDDVRQDIRALFPNSAIVENESRYS